MFKTFPYQKVIQQYKLLDSVYKTKRIYMICNKIKQNEPRNMFRKQHNWSAINRPCMQLNLRKMIER